MSAPRLHIAMFAIGGCLLAAVLALSSTRTNVPEMLTRNTVRLALAWYTVALLLMMHLREPDWAAATRFGKYTRWCRTWAVVCFAVHLTMAFTYYHNWSHDHAFEVTRAASGVGHGIYTLYFFVAFGLADAAWWWARPERYATRAPYIGRMLHAFMLFIVFNGMVVFETGAVRYAGLALFALLAATWVATHGMPLRRQ